MSGLFISALCLCSALYAQDASQLLPFEAQAVVIDQQTMAQLQQLLEQASNLQQTKTESMVQQPSLPTVLHPTSIDLSQELRVQLIGLLNATLADLTNLALATKNAHWNVKGMQFISLHKLFDEFYTQALEHIDTIAERITALGGTAYGTLQAAHDCTAIGSYPLDIFSGEEHLQTLSKFVSQVGTTIRHNMQRASDLGDWDTADIFTKISQDLDKRLWFIQAHLA